MRAVTTQPWARHRAAARRRAARLATANGWAAESSRTHYAFGQ